MSNLELVTPTGNMRHAYASGRRPSAWTYTRTWRGKAILTEEQKAEIRALRAQGVPMTEIAARVQRHPLYLYRVVHDAGTV